MNRISNLSGVSIGDSIISKQSEEFSLNSEMTDPLVLQRKLESTRAKIDLIHEKKKDLIVGNLNNE